MDPVHDEIIEYLPEYSLGLLEDELLPAVEAHLRTCERCQRELAALTATTFALAMSAPEVATPSGARNRFAKLLADDIAAAAPVAAPAPVVAPEIAPAPVAEPRFEPRPPQVPVPLVAERRHWWSAFTPSWAPAAALAVLLVLVGIWGFAQSAEVSRLQNANATITAQIAALQDQLGEQQDEVARLQTERDLAVALMGNPNIAIATLASTGSDDAVARLWIDEPNNRALLITANLDPLPEGQVYELWLISDVPVAIEIFNSEANGTGLVSFQMPGPLDQYQLAAITVETSLVQAPTTQPILAGDV